MIARRRLAGVEQEGAESASCPNGMNEERADARGVARGIEHRGLAAGQRIGAEQRVAVAPAATGGEPAVDLDRQVGAVANELAVDAPSGAERGFDLSRGVVLRREAARRGGDQGFERWLVAEDGGPQPARFTTNFHWPWLVEPSVPTAFQLAVYSPSATRPTMRTMRSFSPMV